MKKFSRNLVLAFLLCVCMLALTGCPSDESKEMSDLKEEMITTARTEVSDWLSVNIPAASLDSDSLEAYYDKYHYFDAVKGKYRDDGTKYEFLYSLGKRKMYIRDERMETVGSIINGKLLDTMLVDFPKNSYRVKTDSCQVFSVVPSIDKGEQSSREVDNRATEIKYCGLPYEVTVDDILNQEVTDLEYSIDIYLEVIFDEKDSLDDFDLRTVRKQGEIPAKPTLWLAGLSDNVFTFNIELYSIDKSQKIELTSYEGSSMTVSYQTLEPTSKEYVETQSLSFRIDHINKTVSRSW